MALLANLPIPVLVVAPAVLRRLRIPWVLWHQDVTAVALKSFAAADVESMGVRRQGLRGGREVVGAPGIGHRGDRRVLRADPPGWGTADKVTVIPNWAPLDEIVPVERANAWSASRA